MMDFLDTRTTIFINIVLNVICTVLVVLLWRNSKKRFNGFGFLSADYILQIVGILLVMGRGKIPDLVSMSLGNTLAMLGAILGYMGLQRFTGMKGRNVHNFALLVISAAIHSYFSSIQPLMWARNINLSVMLLVICAQCAWLLLRKVGPELKAVTRPVGIVFVIYCLVSVVRIPVEAFVERSTSDIFVPGQFIELFILMYLVLFVLLTYALALMVNRRLIMDVGIQEEKFSRAFHSSPNAIVLSKMSDGTIFEVNEAFQRITGFTAHEVLNKTTIELGLWDKDADREKVVSGMAKNGCVEGMEIDFRKKNGDVISGVLAADIIMINKLSAMVSTINDVTERKRDEENIKRLLAEKELILREVHHRIKNNMSVITGILTLQANKLKVPEAVEALRESAGRVRSMMVLYDKLYRADSIGGLSVDEYLTALVAEIIGLFPDSDRVEAATAFDPLVMNGDMLSTIGIIVTELITNSMKYAFTGREEGRITVSLRRKNGTAVISYGDDGVGLHVGVSSEGQTGFGMQLVSMLVKQLRGEMTVGEPGVPGTGYTIEFPL